MRLSTILRPKLLTTTSCQCLELIWKVETRDVDGARRYESSRSMQNSPSNPTKRRRFNDTTTAIRHTCSG
ncbi:hypothetical protein QC764_0003890 [Podospora pseudoanserina]|uniref:Secreted protein n=1 Tax=Podospora pseudoanserina TaxID=2609844 RepID=A0ABR0IL60_9PEZI|nr:hypothetical protein QC764_0003890 [Podospora pseudoanserina]